MAKQIDLIGDVVPTDRVVQVDGAYYIREIGPSLRSGASVLDLGCGIGRSEREFDKLARDISWIGVDIGSSPAVDRRQRSHGRFVTFDGIRLPFRDRTFDCIYSSQVLEHVRHPEQLLAEVARVLMPEGWFIGGTSNLEPYHAYSYWNFTLFGFKTIVEEAGLRVVEMRPGIDGMTLIDRQVRGRPPELNRYFREMSPLNQQFANRKKLRPENVQGINNRMLQFCGHFGFAVTRDR